MQAGVVVGHSARVGEDRVGGARGGFRGEGAVGVVELVVDDVGGAELVGVGVGDVGRQVADAALPVGEASRAIAVGGELVLVARGPRLPARPTPSAIPKQRVDALELHMVIVPQVLDSTYVSQAT